LASFREPLEKKLDQILRKVTKMAVSVDKLQSDVQALVDGGKAKDLLIKQLQDELANADASAQARVDAAVAAEDADAQAKIDAADAVAAEYLNPAPADSGSSDVPADGGDVPPAA
jgi:peptidoglycan hydrolase CwlO-like protein